MRHLVRSEGPSRTRILMMTSALALIAASAAVTAPARADEAAAKKWIDSEFQPSTLSKDDQLKEMQWFIKAAEPFKGMDVNVVSETITTHEYEAQTLAIGTQFPAFRTMEGNPHGFAHTSFGGSIQNPATAPKDPLFFLLHCNVDRLWARWQRQVGRFDPALAAAYDSNPGNPIGHNLGDTMWPWNGVTAHRRIAVSPTTC